MLRTEFLTSLRKALDCCSGLDVSDFEVRTYDASAKHSSKGTTAGLDITYCYGNAYHFRAFIPTSPSGTDEYRQNFTYRISTKESPGTMSSTEAHSYTTRQELLGGVEKWVGRVDADLRALPALRRQAELEDQVAQLIERVGDLPGHDEFFSKAEAAEMSERLDVLESSLDEMIAQRMENDEATAAEIAELHDTITNLKTSLEQLERGNWMKKTVRRMFRWLSKEENRKLLAEGIEAVQDLLPPGGGGS